MLNNIKLWWSARKAEQARMRLLNNQLNGLTDYGLLDRILAGEVQ
jgi:hypothetical protein